MSNNQKNFTEDCKRLIVFLYDTETIISRLVQDEGQYLLVRFARDDLEFRELLKNAWNEAKQNLNEVREKLDFAASSENSDADWLKNELSRRGLTGAQLSLKLYVFERLKSTFRKTKSAIALRRILRHINVLLKSLSGPFTGIDAVSEIKELIEGLLKKERRSKNK